MVHHLIKDLTLLLLVSLPINIAFHRVKLPSVMGYLIAGILIGPHGLKLISDVASIKELAEIERRVSNEGYVLLKSAVLDAFLAFRSARLAAVCRRPI